MKLSTSERLPMENLKINYIMIGWKNVAGIPKSLFSAGMGLRVIRCFIYIRNKATKIIINNLPEMWAAEIF